MVESSAKKFRASSHLASHNVALILIYCSCIPPGEMLFTIGDNEKLRSQQPGWIEYY